MGQAIAVRTDFTAAGSPVAKRAKDAGRRADCWRSQRCSTALRGKMQPRSWHGPSDVAGLGDPVQQQGPDGLINIPSPGVPPKLAKAQGLSGPARGGGSDPGGARCGALAGVDLIMRLHEEFGISVSDDTIYRVLKDLGFSHLSARPKAYKQDPDAMEAFKKTLPYAWRKSVPSSHRAHR